MQSKTVFINIFISVILMLNAIQVVIQTPFVNASEQIQHETPLIATSIGANSCAITNNGALKCWGSNISGNLGNNNNRDSWLYVDAIGLQANVKKVDGNCALRIEGTLFCWGNNSNGQVGDGTTVNRLIPNQVLGLDSNVIDFSSNTGSNCAVLLDGSVKCWGDNFGGRLGTGDTDIRLVPTSVTGLNESIKNISVGDIVCALTISNKVFCWGDATLNLSSIGSLTPRQILGFTEPIKQIEVGGDHACASLCATVLTTTDRNNLV